MERTTHAEQFNHDDEPLTQEEREKQDRLERIPGQPDPSITENTHKTPREILHDVANHGPTTAPHGDHHTSPTTPNVTDDQASGGRSNA